MTTIANWYQWYNIEIRGWYFLEPGEAKTSVDSHHAQVSFEIFLYLTKLNNNYLEIFYLLDCTCHKKVCSCWT